MGKDGGRLQVNIWKFIYLNCGEWNEDMIDHRSYAHNLSSCEIKAWKKHSGLRWSIISSFHSPQFKYMNFHIFTCILHLLRVYYELTKWPAPSGSIAQLVEHCTGIAEVMGSNPVQAWMIFSGFNNCDDQSYLHGGRLLFRRKSLKHAQC